MTAPAKPWWGWGSITHTVGPWDLCREELSVLPTGLSGEEGSVKPLKLGSEQRSTKSSCPDPIVSTVALNFQTPGYEMDLNAGRFLINGQCGYVLKPACLRQPDTNFDPESPGPPRTTLTIQVSSLDQALPYGQSWSWRF